MGSKVGTPTMGGMLILISLFFSIILWGDLSSNLFWLVFSITILFGLIGACDDYKKLKSNSPQGINSSVRLILEFIISFIFIFMLNSTINQELVNVVYIPFTKSYFIDLNFFLLSFWVFGN